MGVELLNGLGGLPDYPVQSNSEYHAFCPGSKSASDNVRGQKGNNPDHLLRSPSSTQSLRKWSCRDSQDVGLEAAII